MGKVKAALRSYLIILGIVVVINIINNLSGYTPGEFDMRAEIVTTLLMTIFGFFGFKALNDIFLRKVLNWNTRTERSFLVFILVSACFGATLIGCFMKLEVFIFHTPDPAWQGYVRNMLYSAMLFLSITLAATLGKFIDHWKQGIEAAARMEQRLAQSQLDLLRNQVNPHFLFNALNTLTSLIREDEEQAVDFVKHLSRILRYSLAQETSGTVTVATELAIADAFLGISAQRFGDKLIYDKTVNAGVLSQQIVSHSLLMLLENALKHNEISRQRPLHINIYSTDNYLFVENNLQLRQSGTTSMGIGLANIVGRYQPLTGKTVNITSDETCWRVGIPLLPGPEDLNSEK
ncbi:sensor histidine kinase [Chitinophaga varians]|uniref:sensor histidine kinase n=1 Tax=Chitinophaga varians TaxID=2202339 RepID=UPI00165FC729|nr:histidine kinase [Chitinophaga varians]MBC9908803.1 histidine kinase [Chitinophaga varians]